MAGEDDLAKQIAELKREAEELSRQRDKRAAKKSKPPEPAEEPPEEPDGEPDDEPADWEKQVEEFVRELEANVNEFTETAEEGFKKHPVMAVAAAFVLGIIIGRISK